jgi:capsular polysaccharide biosynthesis protein
VTLLHRPQLSILWSAVAFSAVLVPIAVTLGIWLSSLLPPRYESRAVLYVGQSLSDPNLAYDGILASQFLAQTYAHLATTRPVLADVVQGLGLSVTATDLASEVTAEVPNQGTILTIVVRDGDANRATAIANAIADRLIRLAPATDDPTAASQRFLISQLDATILAVQQQISGLLGLDSRSVEQERELTNLEDRFATLRATRNSVAEGLPATSANKVTLIERAASPGAAVNVSSLLVVGAFVAAGLILAFSAAYIRSVRRVYRAASAQDVVEQTQRMNPITGAVTPRRLAGAHDDLGGPDSRVGG